MPELQFKGKEFVYNHHLTVPIRPLLPDASKSIGQPHLDGNLIIHGDNLHALQALLPLYAGKVDCIFIDPPYNTGNENWCYNDNVNSPIMREWLNSNPVNKEDMLRHDKWACLMWPRLKLLHELLGENGSLWLTLSEIEVHRAKLLLDEIFGEEHFMADIAWEKVYSSRMDAETFSEDYDHILVYAKAGFDLKKLEFQQDESQFRQVDLDTGRPVRLRSLRKEGSNSRRQDRPNMWYAISAPDGTPIWPIKPDGTEGCWRWEEAKVIRSLEQTPCPLLFSQDDQGRWKIYVKQLYEGISSKPPSTIFYNADCGHTHEALEEIKKIFGRPAFPTVKPVKLIERILDLATEEDSIILDSFAGSGTTAHAILSLNQKDGGNRRFILVECEDYADTLTAERVRRVIQGYDYQGKQKEELLRETITFTKFRQANRLLDVIQGLETMYAPSWDKIDKKIKDGVLTVTAERTVTERTEGLGGTFTYCTLGDPLDLDRLLTGETLPSYETMGAWLFHTATREPFDPSAMNEAEGYLGQSAAYHVWLIYQPDLDFLKSRDAALTLTKAESIAQSRADKRHLVFAPAKFISQKLLNEKNLPVDFAPLPTALFRLERSQQGDA